jgi:hypothetical protein
VTSEANKAGKLPEEVIAIPALFPEESVECHAHPVFLKLEFAEFSV